jgi:hypothetical protein
LTLPPEKMRRTMRRPAHVPTLRNWLCLTRPFPIPRRTSSTGREQRNAKRSQSGPSDGRGVPVVQTKPIGASRAAGVGGRPFGQNRVGAPACRDGLPQLALFRTNRLFVGWASPPDTFRNRLCFASFPKRVRPDRPPPHTACPPELALFLRVLRQARSVMILFPTDTCHPRCSRPIGFVSHLYLFVGRASSPDTSSESSPSPSFLL